MPDHAEMELDKEATTSATTFLPVPSYQLPVESFLMDHTKASFLGIPAELRLEIYRHYFTLRSRSGRGPQDAAAGHRYLSFCGSNNVLYAKRGYPPGEEDFKEQQQFVNLLHTCQIVKREATEVFYKQLTFSIEIVYLAPDSHHHTAMGDFGDLSFMKRIENVLLLVERVPKDIYFKEKALKGILSHLGSAPSRGAFNIFFGGRDYHAIGSIGSSDWPYKYQYHLQQLMKHRVVHLYIKEDKQSGANERVTKPPAEARHEKGKTNQISTYSRSPKASCHLPSYAIEPVEGMKGAEMDDREAWHHYFNPYMRNRDIRLASPDEDYMSWQDVVRQLVTTEADGDEVHQRPETINIGTVEESGQRLTG